jgi:peptidoglycan endopeptidase LytF
MMDRKKTILIAVFINAGLLVVLFVAALKTEEEVSFPLASVQEVQISKHTPLFTDNIDLSVKPPSYPLEAPPEIPPIVALPSIVPETPPLVVAPPVVKETASIEVTVKKGDSLDKLARAHHTTANEIASLNHLSGNSLRVGQTLKIPAGKKKTIAAAPKPTQESSSEYYTVKVGDNPWTIAMKHHIKVEELLKLNGLNEERARKLKPGDRLRIR